MSKEICPACKHEMDPEFCWCGGTIESHDTWEGHYAIPAGCVCFFISSQYTPNGLKGTELDGDWKIQEFNK